MDTASGFLWRRAASGNRAKPASNEMALQAILPIIKRRREGDGIRSRIGTDQFCEKWSESDSAIPMIIRDCGTRRLRILLRDGAANRVAIGKEIAEEIR